MLRDLKRNLAPTSAQTSSKDILPRSLAQVGSYCAPYQGPTNSAIPKGRGTFGAAVEVSAREEHDVRLRIHAHPTHFMKSIGHCFVLRLS